MKRALTRELLDHLPPDALEAIGSRADLVKINWLMGNASFLQLNQINLPGNPVIADLGGGDGTFALRVIERSGVKSGTLLLVDQQNIVSQQTRSRFEKLSWKLEVHATDLFFWLEQQGKNSLDAIFSNLFLHHFSEERLLLLFERVATLTDRFLACEPRRNRAGLITAKLLGLIGCNSVTQHDAVASVHAGFSGSELSALWPDCAGWKLRERQAGFFTHSFQAFRT
ncbi:MAG: class I SAM-dependent methyltransferase [Verrucomicrobiota bacterium]|nr:class I SAM-dependent methyltransferase [Verrucomicrobiota bacterium]